MPVFPIPQSRESDSSSIPFTLPIRISLELEPSERFRYALKTLPAFQEVDCLDDSSFIHLCLSRDLAAKESYSIVLDTERRVIRSSSEAGLYRGLTTLTQLLSDSKLELPSTKIDDYPNLKTRGYMLDISRCRVPTLESLYALVDQLATLKFNQFQLYTEHTFAYPGHESVWHSASPFTSDEIHALDSYCYYRYIELVPNQNTFGHMDRWLRHDAYKNLAECPEGYIHPFLGQLPWGGTLKPNRDSLDFVDSLFELLLPHFRSQQINIGGDEPWELGQGWSRHQVKELGKHRVYLDHLKEILKLASERGKRAQFWGDIVLESPDLASELPDDAIGLIWGYEAGHPFHSQCEMFSRTGISFCVAPGSSNWNSIGGRYDNTVANIQEATQEAIRFNADGMLLTSWGDFGNHHFAFTSYPALIWAAGLSWNRGVSLKNEDAAYLNDIFLEGKSQKLAEAIVTLGRIQNGFSHQPENRTLLNDILFARDQKLDQELAKTSIDELNDALHRLNSLGAKVERLNHSTDTVERIAEELAHSIDWLIFAACKGLKGLGCDTAQPQSLDSLTDRYRFLWLKTNRIGGLEESIQHFENANR